MNFKGALVFFSTTVITLLASLMLIQHFLPELLHAPAKVEIVTLDEKKPAFYRPLLNPVPDYNEFMTTDPEVIDRTVPFYPEQDYLGPHDALGFRNKAVPNTVDIVAIGDSFTYGINAKLQYTWPQVLGALINQSIYNMASPGWGAVQYRYMFDKALTMQPKRIIVAFYTGNDAFDSFYTAYGNELWPQYKVNSQLSIKDMPDVAYPPPEKDWFVTTLPNNKQIVFTPTLRLASNVDTPAVDAGYDIMKQVALEMDNIAHSRNIELVFTIIPTKETAYANYLTKNNIDQSDAFNKLNQLETQRINDFSSFLVQLQHARYVDIVTPIINAVNNDRLIYPRNRDGHFTRPGYHIIGGTLANAL